MRPTSPPRLSTGRVYRTRDLRRWSANAPRLAKRLVRRGLLRRLGRGLYVRPASSRFGDVPPADEAVVRAFLDGGPFVLTGPERWNALGLGTTALFATPLVYNTKRSGTFAFGGREMRFRRVAFPRCPCPEWFVVDLFEHAESAGASHAALVESLSCALAGRRFDPGRLREMTESFGTRRTRDLVGAALRRAHV